MNRFFYVAANDSGENGGIYRCEWDALSGVKLRGFTRLANTNFLLLSPRGDRLYAGGGGEESGFVAAFDCAADGALKPAKLQACPMRNCHLAIAGDFLYAANYGDGSFSEFPLKNGLPCPESQCIRHTGAGPVAGRQDAPHVHSCNPSPDGRFLAVCDLGTDTISSYRLVPDGVTPAPEAVFHCAPGDGPRHLLFAPGGRTAYLVNELGNSLVSLRFEDGCFSLLKKISTMPRFFTEKSKAAAVRFSPDGTRIAVTNRGFDSAAVFTAGAEGAIKRTGLFCVPGASPRDGNFIAPDVYAAACENSGKVIFFDYRGGELAPNGCELALPCPLYLLPGHPRG